MTKEEIKNKIASDNNFDSFERAIRYTFNRELLHSEKEFIDKLIDEAMQEYSDQQTANLKAIKNKQAEYLAYLKRAIHSESIIDNITAGARDKFDAELQALQSGKEPISGGRERRNHYNSRAKDNRYFA